MHNTAQAVEALLGAALTAVDSVPDVAPSPGFPYFSGWQFDVEASGLRTAQATLSVDLDSMWNQRNRHPEVAVAKETLVVALLEEHEPELERAGVAAGDMPPQQVAEVVTRQILYRSAGMIDGSARWDVAARPDAGALTDLIKRELQCFLEGESALADVIAPLAYCDTELATPAELRDGLRLVPLSEGHVTRLLSGPTSAYGGVSPHEAHDWELAVVATIPLDVPGTLDRAFAHIEDVVVSLRLLRHSAVGVVHHLIRPRGLSLRERGSGVHLGAPTHGASLNVSEGDLGEVASFTSPGASTRQGRLALAIRRLLSAESRRSHQDRLIDYWVGLEALYGVGGTSEVSYRVGIRMAHTLAQGAEAQKALFKGIKDSYNLRSSVVHGDPKRIGKVTQQSADEAERWLRESIRVWWASNDGPGEAEFDQYLFRD